MTSSLNDRKPQKQKRLPRLLIALDNGKLYIENVRASGIVQRRQLTGDCVDMIDTLYTELEVREAEIKRARDLELENERQENAARSERIFARTWEKHGFKLAAKVEPEIAQSYINGKKAPPKPTLKVEDLDL